MKRLILENKAMFLVSFFVILFAILSFLNYIYNFNLAHDTFLSMKEATPNLVASFNKKDAFNVFLDIVNLTNFRILILISPFIAIIPNLFSEKSKSFKSALILPVGLLILFALSFVFSPSFTIDEKSMSTLIMQPQYNKEAIVYIFIIILDIFALGLYFINISEVFKNLFKSRVHTLIFSFIFIALVVFIAELVPQISLLDLFYNMDIVILNTIFIMTITSISFLTVKGGRS